MLVLSRKVGERIVMAGASKITVLQIRGTKVLLGVTAPRHDSVHRLEAKRELTKATPSN